MNKSPLYQLLALSDRTNSENTLLSAIIAVSRSLGTRRFAKVDNLFNDKSSNRRFIGAWLLAGRPSEIKNRALRLRAEDILKRLCLKDPSPRVKWRAIKSLGTWNSRANDYFILRFARHPNPKIRIEVAHALSKPFTKQTTKYLLLLLKDNNCKVREWTAFLLGQYACCYKSQLIRELRIRSSDISKGVRLEALRSLIFLRDLGCLNILKKSIQNLGSDLHKINNFMNIAERQLRKIIREPIQVDSVAEILRYLFIREIERKVRSKRKS